MAAVTIMKTPAETGLRELFDRLKGGLPGDVAVREAALAGLGERGLPHRRVEEFKYFDLRTLMREAASPSARPGPTEIANAAKAETIMPDLGTTGIVFVNGHLASDLGAAKALPGGIEAVSLSDALDANHPARAMLGSVEVARANPLVDLNTAFMSDGVILHVPAGASPEAPIVLRFLNAGATAFSTATRILVVVGEGATVTLVETHQGPSGLGYQPNDVVELIVGDKATVRHIRVNQEGQEALALSTLTARIGSEASLGSTNVVTGASASRHQVFVAFMGEGSTAQIDGINLLRGRQHADSTLVIDHAVPHCTSREAFKTILDDDAIGVFQGKIVVRPHAQKTDGGMKSDTLLLSDGASMNNKPELEIFADDVVCGHGATCGALDEDLLFYLKSRGLPRAEAESLLLQAFVGAPIETIENEPVREAVVGIVEAWLAGRH